MQNIFVHIRDSFSHDCTGGRLFIDGRFFCYTLEDAVRPPSVKIPGYTAIPAGVYVVDVSYSTKFERKTVHLYNQDDWSIEADGVHFSGLRVHRGNTSVDTAGCILVGYERISSGSIASSTQAETDLMAIIESQLSIESIYWSISHDTSKVLESHG